MKIKKLLFLPLYCVVLSATASCAGGAGNKGGAAAELPQFSPPASGEELAVLHTNYGDIKLRFFPGEAPKAVGNFITHAKDGYYDGTIFHRVINEFMIQGGDPEGTGMGGESIWGGGFGYETSKNVRHFRGALAMAHSQAPDSNGSQFYIVQNTKLDPGMVSQLDDIASQITEIYNTQSETTFETPDGKVFEYRDIMPPEVIDAYKENGGTPHLDLMLTPDGHTVFGHVYEGMDVVDAIAAVPVVDAANQDYRPVSDVIIESITFETVP